ALREGRPVVGAALPRRRRDGHAELRRLQEPAARRGPVPRAEGGREAGRMMLHRLVALCTLLLPLAAAAATRTVHPGEAIQPALDAAAPGDTVEVQRGHYAGNLKITKTLTLRGIDRPTISGALQGDTIRITAA